MSVLAVTGRATLHLAAVLVLTAVTQVGGACYALGLAMASAFGRRAGVVGGLLLYAVATVAVLPAAAPLWGRVALPCGVLADAAFAPRSVLFCALNRHYGTPELAAALKRIAAGFGRRHPGSVVAYLDAGFPLPFRMPMLPHLSHRDGRAVDLALFYAGRPMAGAWPVGYFAFAPAAALARPVCDRPGRLRWSMDWLQPAFAGLTLDRERTADLVRATVADPAVRRVLLHPGLTAGLGAAGAKIRFAGCRAARHDDHLHLEVGTH